MLSVRSRSLTLFGVSALLAFGALAPVPLAAQQGRALDFESLMRIRQIEHATLSHDGRWLALTAQPDRGDPELLVHATGDERRHAVARASHPALTPDGRWVAARLNPSLEATETAPRGAAPRRGMVLLDTSDGTVLTFDDVQTFAFSSDGAWLAYHRFAPRPDSGDAPRNDDEETGSTLVLRDLAAGTEIEVGEVRGFAFAPAGSRLAYEVAGGDSARDGLYLRDLAGAPSEERPLHQAARGRYASLTWHDDGHLAFTHAVDDGEGEPGPAQVMAWRGGEVSTLVAADGAPEGWRIPSGSDLAWSDDGQRLYFGWRPAHADEIEDAATSESPEGDEEAFDPYDLDAILDGRGVDVWHWRDPRIMTQQKVMWSREQNRTYRAVHHLDAGRTVALGALDLPDVGAPETGSRALGRSDLPYRWESTWAGGASDLYVVDLDDGTRTLVAERLQGQAQLSPTGRYVVFWNDGAYHLHDADRGTTRSLTEGLGVPFANELHDTPDEPGGYGLGGWIEGDRAVLVYDRFDIWVVPTEPSAGEPWMLTDGRGRAERREFRVVDTDPETEAIAPGATLLLASYHDLQKSHGFYRARADRPGVTALLEDARRFAFRGKAQEADVLLYTREDYDEFPDLWITDPDFDQPRRVTDVNPNLDEFAWGTSELVEWRSLDGTPLQGVVIKPGNYVEGQRYPVLVYYYERFSQRLHEFNEPAVNHRPSFPLYASNGYVVFLPDVVFEVGQPGYSATKAVVSGVQHLIDIGLADPDAIALHGHSWSGYQTAHVITESDIFRTAIAGAPVANMTSAYSGIRWGSGVARQFQYEQGQSRISGSLWEARDEYIENSPVFFADRINTPLLILHGDVDDAVPWYQSIELYLAMRRLGKEAVFLQYRDEPHHPQTYANKLDWAMKMKQWLDHYLKGDPPAAWITEGVPYSGR